MVLMAALTASLSRADALSDDVTAKRARLVAKLGRDTLFIAHSAPSRVYSLDVNYEYHQDSNLYYLTGIAQEETILVLMPGNTTRREILFMRDRDASREHWDGTLLSPEEATARSGVTTVLRASQFDDFIAAMLTGRRFGPIDEGEARAFFTALANGNARVSLLLSPGRVSDPMTPEQTFARTLRDRYAGFQVTDATPHLVAMRLVKTPYEQTLLVRAAEISAAAQIAGMLAAHPAAYEYEVKAAIEAASRSRGAISWAYPSIVGSGPNTTILHYPDSRRQMQSGDLLLTDAACNYDYMTSDITRTYPVNGHFTVAQKAIYDIVLAAQDEAFKAATAGSSLQQIHDKASNVIRNGLFALGLITDPKSDQYRMWFTHGTSHYIGLDVHDVGANTVKLEPGMAFTIEPGLYIRQSALDTLPRTPENLALIEKIQPAVTKYAGIGIRIEDSILLDTTGPRRLSAAVPRTIPEIEALMQQRTVPSTTAPR
ncbi:MAG: aminopeptidase P N-terminal domain-containing protein [Acidobacteriaceae bacterium]|nr:aminopeptidase P N-terminal domain-containing protein [Acidobacteriaceae bacterium]